MQCGVTAEVPSFGQVAKDRSEGKAQAKSLKTLSLGLASLNNFGGLWVMMEVSSCLVPAPGVIQSEEYCFLWVSGPERGDLALYQFVSITNAYSQLSPLLSSIGQPQEGPFLPSHKGFI